MKKISILLSLLLAGVAITGCFDMKEHPFTLLDAENYYTNEDAIKQVIANIYAAEQIPVSKEYWYAQDVSADQVTWRTWNGGNYGWDGAYKFVISTHTWTPLATMINDIWSQSWEAIGMCNIFLDDIAKIDLETVGITEEKRQAYIAEVKTFRVYCYYNVFELFGGAIPLCLTPGTTEIPKSASDGTSFEEGCRIVCNWMEEELDENLSLLPKGGSVNRVTQAFNRVMKMRLLLNAEIFTGTARFAEAKAVAKDIIDGKYGNYQIVDRYQDIYSYNNDTCPEIIFAFALEQRYNKSDATNQRNVPFMTNTFTKYFNCTQINGAWDCTTATPSFDNSNNFYAQCVPALIYNEAGAIDREASVVKEMYNPELAKCFLDPPYNDKLGAVHQRFDPRDIRLVAPYCDDEGNWGGLFMEGVMRESYGTGNVQDAKQDRKSQPQVYVDQIGNFQGKGNHPVQIVENPRWGEENSGLRTVKYPFYTTASGHNVAEADEVEFRLAEVYYTYAECLLREGNKAEAKEWVNKVRKRYFSDDDWNNAGVHPTLGTPLVGAKDQAPRGFSADFDMDRMLSEWGIEFYNEGHRRRTDLRRYDKFTQGQWWFFGRATEPGYDLPAKRDRKYEWYPLPQRAVDANPGLVQNPDYV